MIEVLHRINYDPNIVFENGLEVKHSDYEKVAEIDSDALADAWALTQNNDRDWINNRHVKYFGKATDCRSTSIGDVFSMNGCLEMVMPLGYVSFHWGDNIFFYASIKNNASSKIDD
ncbi:hypothetical protein [Adhaeribacter rhizoryzae]|uniref:Uncharacterized protein n=1 Tax=Adhaeribacter rhizoryzae TaxID=2607907 RepID=A0A5M6CWR2_9BACT|nr:hypothetical protein [Adhaeribacter rhizoryzae]KAA5539658.1 hypothetical protein F0145_24025 [Adhaeribacter rhizoryzae]